MTAIDTVFPVIRYHTSDQIAAVFRSEDKLVFVAARRIALHVRVREAHGMAQRQGDQAVLVRRQSADRNRCRRPTTGAKDLFRKDW